MFRKSITNSKTRVGSFFLTPATALRYERHDRKVQQMTKEAELGLGKDRRRVDINEEYYRLAAKVSFGGNRGWEDLKAEPSCRIWTIGKIKGSKDYLAKMMGYEHNGNFQTQSLIPAYTCRWLSCHSTHRIYPLGCVTVSVRRYGRIGRPVNQASPLACPLSKSLRPLLARVP